VAVNLIVGPAGSGKGKRLLELYSQLADQRPVLVLPTYREVDLFRRRLEAKGEIFHSDVVVFDQLMKLIASNYDSQAKLPSSTERSLIFRRAVRQVDLGPLSSLKRSKGFISLVQRSIDELQQCGVSSDQFKAVVTGSAGIATDLLAEIFVEYTNTLRRHGLSDRGEEFWNVLKELERDPKRLEPRPLLLYAFSQFTVAQRKAIELLDQKVGANLFITLTCDAESDRAGALALVQREYQRFAPVAQSIEKLKDSESEAKATDLQTLKQALRQGNFGNYEQREKSSSDATVVLVENKDTRSELLQVASAVKSLISSGVPPEQIAILFRSTSKYQNILLGTLSSLSIPSASVGTFGLLDTQIGRAFTALVRCVLEAEGTSITQLMMYLRSTVDASAMDAVDELYLRCRRLGVKSVGQALKLDLESGLLFSGIDRLRSAKAENIESFIAELRSELRAQYLQLQGGPSLSSQSAGSELESEIFALIDEMLARISDGYVEKQAGTEELLTLLEELKVQRRLDRVQSGVVYIADAQQPPVSNFDHVFICGMQAGEFPRSQSSDQLLPDRVRDLLVTKGYRLESRQDGDEDELHRFYLCVESAEKTLQLSWRADSENSLTGESRSPYIDQTLRTLPDSSIDSQISKTRTKEVKTKKVAAKSPSEQIKRYIDSREEFSAREIECLVACPTRWLVEHVSKPQRVQADPPQLVRGTLIHEVLEKLYRELDLKTIDQYGLSNAQTFATQTLNQSFNELALDRSIENESILLRANQDITNYLQQECADPITGRALPNRLLEWQFGKDSDNRSLTLQGTEVTVSGRIDRVDTDSKLGVVVDYKTGRVGPNMGVSSWLKSGQLQVALYMLAVKQNLGVQPVSGVYVPLGGDELRPRGVFLKEAEGGLLPPLRAMRPDLQTESELDETLKACQALAAEAIERVRTGDLTPTPHSCFTGACAYPELCDGG